MGVMIKNGVVYGSPGGGSAIDDNTISLITTWSSKKISESAGNKVFEGHGAPGSNIKAHQGDLYKDLDSDNVYMASQDYRDITISDLTDMEVILKSITTDAESVVSHTGFIAEVRTITPTNYQLVEIDEGTVSAGQYKIDLKFDDEDHPGEMQSDTIRFNGTTPQVLVNSDTIDSTYYHISDTYYGNGEIKEYPVVIRFISGTALTDNDFIAFVKDNFEIEGYGTPWIKLNNTYIVEDHIPYGTTEACIGDMYYDSYSGKLYVCYDNIPYPAKGSRPLINYPSVNGSYSLKFTIRDYVDFPAEGVVDTTWTYGSIASGYDNQVWTNGRAIGRMTVTPYTMQWKDAVYTIQWMNGSSDNYLGLYPYQKDPGTYTGPWYPGTLEIDFGYYYGYAVDWMNNMPQSLVEFFWDNALTVEGYGRQWIQINLVRPVVRGNLYILNNSEDYNKLNGSNNLIITQNYSPAITDDADSSNYIIGPQSYENAVIGYGNKIGASSGSGSRCQNIVVGTGNNIGTSYTSTISDHHVFGSSNTVSGCSDSETVIGNSNAVTGPYSGLVAGSSNTVTASGSNIDVIGSRNTISGSMSGYSGTFGADNIISSQAYVLGMRNNLTSTSPRAGASFVIGDSLNSSSPKYAKLGTVIGTSNSIGDSSLGSEYLYAYATVGDNNTLSSSLVTVSGKYNHLGTDNYALIGCANTVSGAETVVGHHNTVSQAAAVIGNYNTMQSGYYENDPSDSNYIRFTALCIGINNNSPWGGSSFVIGRNNTATMGSSQVMGDSITSSSGASAVGYGITVTNGSFAMGRSLSMNNNGGNCLLVGGEISLTTTAYAIGSDITCSRGGSTLIGKGLALTAPVGTYSQSTVVGAYNEDLPASATFALGNGYASLGTITRHTLMYADSANDVYFSDKVYADNLPAAPSTDGSYVLGVSVSSGTETYAWSSGGGGGGSSLPAVTSADEGKLLAVNSSGQWDKSNAFEEETFTFVLSDSTTVTKTFLVKVVS